MPHPMSSASAVFMVHPTSFGYDDQTAQTNAFQRHLSLSDAVITAQASAEFDVFVGRLRERGIKVLTFRDDDVPHKPNGVFANNWLSTWPDGRVYLYPMATQSRRFERSPAAVQHLASAFQVSEIIDLSAAEADERYLESSGAVIYDHVHKKAYACISTRCDESLFREHMAVLGYEAMAFRATDQHGIPVYHTNVMMSVQSSTAIICTEAIRDTQERSAVVAALRKTGHVVVTISFEQMARFCGSVLELHTSHGEQLLVLSQTAYEAFTPDQLTILGRDKQLVTMNIPTIETIGGGSVRCMMAEVFLSLRTSGKSRPAKLDRPEGIASGIPHKIVQ